MVFGNLPAEDAGGLIRIVFPWYYLFIIATAGLGGLILLASNFRSGALALTIAVVAIYARQILMPQINAARDLQSKGAFEAKARFSRLHSLSVALNFIQLLRREYILYCFL